jgi:hypothetical protein
MKDIEKLHCEICKKEIPRSVAISFEGMDYVHNFCSIECHEHYFVDHPEEKKEEEEKPR